ncbi:MAG: hypothetical protein L3J35_05830 [Bacteroidales bacterium]|nr:hypothetical protein [Bacteroidales bacterium]
MKKLLIIISISAFSITSFSQDKKILKIESYFNQAEYNKCISKSNDYISKNDKQPAPYFYLAMSEYEIYKKQSDIKTFKSIVKNLYKGLKKDKDLKYKKLFETELNDIHTILKTNAYNYYEANKNQSRFYYDYLAKIYNDTLEQYNEVVLNIEPRPDAKIIELIKKGELNQTDENGLKQGKWKKVYSNGVTAYEVFFKDNKPTGELKRYHENGTLSSLLDYDDEGKFAHANFYNEKGKKISEGTYKGKQKVGKWIYFKEDTKIKEEEYKDGKLHGFQITYFDNGQIYDKKKFVNGIQIGVWEKYHKNGKPSLKAFLVNGLMDGPVLRYYPSGLIEVKGQYKNDLKEGKWTFYSEDGETDIIEYKKGVDINEAEVEKKESEEYKKNIEKGKNLLDPANFKDNPEDYPFK